ncbi:hypothetical protein [Cupriavidus basilensis]|uniref:Permeases of the major facilitator superfamily n=1 Tax=Cupriavidus basilensis TaxID=68895 RepID=A0A0C4YMW9_9BURK|nr:hypothetical protein [Cupriavidus basilensis]AJG24388.1 Permeases of the major facilitator superfamily [Cupriavidus basilensis]
MFDMNLLVFKLIVTPLLLLAASVAVRRWGETVGGFLVGLPLTSGPISVFLALEHGSTFAEHATSGSLAATAAQVAFCLAYCRLATLGWPIALSGACVAFAVAATALQWSGLAQTGLFVVAMSAMTVVLYVTPRSTARGKGLSSPWWDLPARMVLITCLVVSVTLIAPYVGPQASGVLASFPFMATILAIFAHRLIGAAAARQVLRGMVAGLFGFAAFFYVLSLTLTRLSLFVAYSGAILTALAVQAISLHRMRLSVPQIAE